MRKFGVLAALALAGCSGAAPAADPVSGAAPFTIREVATFDTPWAMSFLPGSGVALTSMALVSEKDGRLWLVDVASGQRRAVAGVPAVHVDGQGGLGDVVVHPDFAANRRVYLSFVETGAGGSGAALGYGTLKLGEGAPQIENFKLIWRQSPKVDGSGHFGHRVVFAPDGSLFLSSGERQKFTPAQQTSNNLGKILHLTAEGAPAAGNPWSASNGVAREFWTMGHRNALGLAFAPDGRLWETEMGPQGGDELNLIMPGKNYGYPIVSNGSHYGGLDIPDHSTRPDFEAPKRSWNPSISPGSLLIYSGDRFPDWKGDALIGALSGEALIHVAIDGDTIGKTEQWPMGARIRSVNQGPEGEIYLLEDAGRLLRLDPAKKP